MKTLKITIVLTIALGIGLMLQSPSFAAISTGAMTVSADVPLLTQALNVRIYPVSVDVNGVETWGSAVGNMSGFGGIAPNFTYNIFLAAKYYAVDVSVTDNSGNEWYITHAISSIKRGATTDNLDYNTNVAFSKVTKSPTDPTDPTKDVDTLLPVGKKAFAESAVTSSTALSKTALGGGWLRIRYGIATGEATKDATNAKPIGLDKRNGTYSGSVTITLSP